MSETSKTVSQALGLLVEVGERKGSIAELTRRTGMHRTVVQRLLATLREQGFVMRAPDGTFTLGATVTDLAARAESPVRVAAAEPMVALAQQANETVALALRDGDDAVSAKQVRAVKHLVRAEYPIGSRHPLSRAANGRAILMASDPGTVDRLVADADDGAELLRKLDEARRLGYAVSVDELKQGAAGISAPVIGRTGYAVASVGIIAPADRLPEPATIGQAVIDAAEVISAALCS